MKLSKEQLAVINKGSYTLQDLVANIKKAGIEWHKPLPIPKPLVAVQQPINTTPNLNYVATDMGDTMDAGTQISIALRDKDINEDVAVLLKEKFQNDTKGLRSLLASFAKERLRHLMSLPYVELDKSGESEELYNKYLQGYKYKVNQNFGTADKMAKDGVTDGVFTEQSVEGWKRNFGNDNDKFIQIMFADIQRNIDNLMGESWDTLAAKGKIDFLKTNYLQGYKQKYIAKYGSEYKQPK